MILLPTAIFIELTILATSLNNRIQSAIYKALTVFLHRKKPIATITMAKKRTRPKERLKNNSSRHITVMAEKATSPMKTAAIPLFLFRRDILNKSYTQQRNAPRIREHSTSRAEEFIAP